MYCVLYIVYCVVCIASACGIKSGHSQLPLQLFREILVDVLIVPILSPLFGLNFGRRVRVIGAFFELLKIVLVFFEQPQHLGVLDDFFYFLLGLLDLLGFFVLVLVLG